MLLEQKLILARSYIQAIVKAETWAATIPSEIYEAVIENPFSNTYARALDDMARAVFVDIEYDDIDAFIYTVVLAANPIPLAVFFNNEEYILETVDDFIDFAKVAWADE